MIQHTYIKKLFAAMIIIAVIAFVGCEKKTEETKPTTDDIKTETISSNTASSVDLPDGEPVEVSKIQIPDLKGTWSGTFDKRTTTLTITEQTDSSFSGKISISYREAINQEVKGTISPTTMKMSMKDQLHSRYQGKYNGKLSEDGKKFSFNLNKK